MIETEIPSSRKHGLQKLVIALLKDTTRFSETIYFFEEKFSNGKNIEELINKALDYADNAFPNYWQHPIIFKEITIALPMVNLEKMIFAINAYGENFNAEKLSDIICSEFKQSWGNKITVEEAKQISKMYISLVQEYLSINSEKYFRITIQEKGKELSQEIHEIKTNVERILENDFRSRSSKYCHNIQKPSICFVNRQKELDKCDSILTRSNNLKCIILPKANEGLGGLGKTELALKIVDVFFANKVNGALLFNVGNIDWNQDSFFREILLAIDRHDLISTYPDKNRQQVEELFKKFNYVFVIDNLIQDKNNFIIDWLCKLPNSLNLIITTRQNLYLPIPNITYIRISGIEIQYIHILLEKIGERFSSSKIINLKDKIIDRLGSVLCGYPLAYEWVCVLIEFFDNEITEIETLIRQGDKNIYGSLFNGIFSNLSKNEKTILSIIAYFNNYCGDIFLSALFNFYTQENISQFIDKLSIMNLISIYPMNKSYKKYELHDVTRLFIRAQNVFINSLNEYNDKIINILSSFLKENAGNDNWVGFEKIDSYFENIKQIIDFCSENDNYHSEFLSFVIMLDHYCYTRGQWNLRKSWGEIGIKISRKKNEKEKTAFFCFNNLAEYFGLTGNYEIAMEWIKRGFENIVNLENSFIYAQGCYERSRILRKLKKKESLDWALKAESIYTQLSNSNPENRQYMRGLGYVLNGIGNIYYDQRDFEQSREYYDKSMSIFKYLNEPLMIGVIERNLGRLYFGSENDESLKHYRIALSIFTEINSIFEILQAKAGIGKILFLSSDPHKKEVGVNYLNIARKGFLEQLAFKEATDIQDYLSAYSVDDGFCS
ncbi:MAG: tetratricopeptide repeat protein [Candidatus Methanofastidiosa archaeon]|nr:tetratricopeptide repeat protein [Candidatus Methanofastidiosa archaeon]